MQASQKISGVAYNSPILVGVVRITFRYEIPCQILYQKGNQSIMYLESFWNHWWLYEGLGCDLWRQSRQRRQWFGGLCRLLWSCSKIHPGKISTRWQNNQMIGCWPLLRNFKPFWKDLQSTRNSEHMNKYCILFANMILSYYLEI